MTTRKFMAANSMSLIVQESHIQLKPIIGVSLHVHKYLNVNTKLVTCVVSTKLQNSLITNSNDC